MSDNPLQWQGNTEYSVGRHVRADGKYEDYLFIVHTAGTSGSSTPTFEEVEKTYTTGALDSTNSVTDNTVVWTAEKIYEATDQELYWEIVGDFSVGNELDNLFQNINNTTSAILPWLDLAVTAVELASLFISAGVSPTLQALSYIFEQLVDYIKDLRREGFHWIFIYPNQSLYSDFINLDKLTNIEAATKYTFTEEKLSYDEYKKQAIATNWSNTVLQHEKVKSTVKSPIGIYTLKSSKALKALKESFDDGGDNDRPPIGDDVYAGGLCIHLGIKGKIPDLMDQILGVYELFDLIFSSKETKRNKDKIKSIKEYIEISKKKYSDDQLLALKTAKKTPPDWKTIRAAELMGYDEILLYIQSFFEGMKLYVDKQIDKLKDMTDFLEAKINAIEKMITQIETVIESIISIQNTIKGLGDQLRIMYIEPQAGGLTKFKEAITNEAIINSPDPETDYSVMACAVGSGTAFSILASALLPDTASITFSQPSDTITNSDWLKNKFGFLDQDDIDDFDNKVKKRINNRADYYDSIGMPEEAENYRNREEFSKYMD